MLLLGMHAKFSYGIWGGCYDGAANYQAIMMADQPAGDSCKQNS